VSSSLLRQDVLPVGVGYLLVMGALAIGLRLLRRESDPAGGRASGPVPGVRARGVPGVSRREGDPARGRASGPVPGVPTVPGRRVPGAAVAGSAAGWPRLARHYAGTAVGGYLLLMAVVVLYHYGVARVGGAFIKSAFTGCAVLLAVSTPVFALASWLAERRASRATGGRARASRARASRRPGP
jgi:hypothetical protein